MIQMPLEIPKGYVLWEGESRLTGNHIVAIITGMGGSSNGKTGNMLQTWILCYDLPPGAARRSGQDADICGDCLFRMHGALVGAMLGCGDRLLFGERGRKAFTLDWMARRSVGFATHTMCASDHMATL